MAKDKHGNGIVTRLKEKVVRIKNFFSSRSVQFVMGLLCIAFMLFLGSSFLSFLSSGGNDQSVVEAVSAGDISTADAAANTSGKSGAVLASYLINDCFGWASVFLLPLLLLVALRLMRLGKIPFKRGVAVLLFATFWFSVLFSLAFGGRMGGSFVSPGGKHGDSIA
ncbi:MAG: hypothetical protein IIW77_02270, partial [Bacteroidaceae bacterium]|nr:hypothetical protein [Bacteroidaceae bacterium]